MGCELKPVAGDGVGVASMVGLPFTLQTLIPLNCNGWRCYDAGFRWGMGRATLKIVLSLVGAGVSGLAIFVLLEAMLPEAHTRMPGRVLFRFQLSSMIAMAVFAGLAIVIYVRLSRKG